MPIEKQKMLLLRNGDENIALPLDWLKTFKIDDIIEIDAEVDVLRSEVDALKDTVGFLTPANLDDVRESIQDVRKEIQNVRESFQDLKDNVDFMSPTNLAQVHGLIELLQVTKDALDSLTPANLGHVRELIALHQAQALHPNYVMFQSDFDNLNPSTIPDGATIDIFS